MNTTTQHTIADDAFSREPLGHAAATATERIDLADGAAFDLVAAPIEKRIGDAEHHEIGTMLTFRVVA
jgi:hypothetical protein